MAPWIKRGVYEFGKVSLVFGALMVCYMLIIALCASMGINPVWGYVAVFVIGGLSVTVGTEKFKHDLLKARVEINKKEEK